MQTASFESFVPINVLLSWNGELCILILIEKHICHCTPRPFWPFGQVLYIKPLQFLTLMNVVCLHFFYLEPERGDEGAKRRSSLFYLTTYNQGDLKYDLTLYCLKLTYDVLILLSFFFQLTQNWTALNFEVNFRPLIQWDSSGLFSKSLMKLSNLLSDREIRTSEDVRAS